MEDEHALVAQFQELDRRDEAQIIAAMSGVAIDEYVYRFKDEGGRQQMGLSWAGLREMAQHQGNIRVDAKPEVSETDHDFRVMALAVDHQRNVAIWGGCHQPKQMKVYDRDQYGNKTGEFHYVADPYCYEKAIAKAQRNAIKALMPVTLIKAMITEFCKEMGIPLPEPKTKAQGRKPEARPSQSTAQTQPATRLGETEEQRQAEWQKIRSLQKDLNLDELVIKSRVRRDHTELKGKLRAEWPPIGSPKDEEFKAPSELTLEMLKGLRQKLEGYKESVESLKAKKEETGDGAAPTEPPSLDPWEQTKRGEEPGDQPPLEEQPGGQPQSQKDELDF